eukprot:NODE_8067_length_403_cov_112.732759.p1 GENE.NODE_8067_length_403_cov_112.732759~~NODE_8067_length_403_cov_112.732759.p1  ORF type:complete len:88 (-),score=3.43 NODE_8067_length_403_cov_112.732759:90-353(-)
MGRRIDDLTHAGTRAYSAQPPAPLSVAAPWRSPDASEVSSHSGQRGLVGVEPQFEDEKRPLPSSMRGRSAARAVATSPDGVLFFTQP